MAILLLKRIWRQSEVNQWLMFGHYFLTFRSKKEIIQWANPREMWSGLHTWCHDTVQGEKVTSKDKIFKFVPSICGTAWETLQADSLQIP